MLVHYFEPATEVAEGIAPIAVGDLVNLTYIQVVELATFRVRDHEKKPVNSWTRLNSGFLGQVPSALKSW